MGEVRPRRATEGCGIVPGERGMLRRIGFAILLAIAGYLVAAVASYFLIEAFSSNTHDRSLEAAMSSAFFYGPIGAVLGFIGGVVAGGRGRGAAHPTEEGRMNDHR